MKQLAELKEKKTGLMEFTSGLQSTLADLAIKIPDAESHPLVRLVKEEALSSAKKLDEVVSSVCNGHAIGLVLTIIRCQCASDSDYRCLRLPRERDQRCNSQLSERFPST